MRKLRASQPGGFWLVTGAAILWGTIGVATQAIYATDTTSSLFINLARMLVAAPVLLVAGWRLFGRTLFHIRQRDFRIMLLSGSLLAISQAAYFVSIRYASVTIATLLTICIAPVVVTGVSVLLKSETLTGRTIMALAFALVGSALLVGLQSPAGTSSGADDHLALGTLFALVSAVTYAIMIICGRYLAADYHPLQVTAVTFTIGALVLVPLNLIGGIAIVHSARNWLLLVYLGLVPTAVAYWLFQMGLRSVSATAASIVSMLDPVMAAVLAWALFGETLPASGVTGAALLILSIVVLSLDRSA